MKKFFSSIVEAALKSIKITVFTVSKLHLHSPERSARLIEAHYKYEVNETSLLYCGSTETIPCKQPHGYAGVTRTSKKVITFNGQTLYHKICKNCGTVVRSYIESPETF